MLLLVPIQKTLIFCFKVTFITMFHGIAAFANLDVSLLISQRQTVVTLFTDKCFVLPSVTFQFPCCLLDLSTIIANKFLISINYFLIFTTSNNFDLLYHGTFFTWSVSPYLCPLLGGILLLKYYVEIKIFLWKKSNHLHDERYNTEISFGFARNI